MSGIVVLDSNSMFNCLNRQTVFQSGCTILHSYQPMYEDYNFCTSSPTLVIFCLWNSSHPGGCKLVFYCGFDLRVPSN